MIAFTLWCIGGAATYHHAYDGKAPGEGARFLVSRPGKGALEVVILTIDFSDLDRVPGQLTRLVEARVS